MCGRYTNTVGFTQIVKQFGVHVASKEGTRRYNVAPSEKVLAIVAPHGDPETRLLRWGLIPTWAKDPNDVYKMINARMETVSAKPAYRDLIPKASRRALQIADGYFEWIKPEKPGQRRQPFYFQVDGGLPFAFAALWTPAKVKGEWIESCTLLTCDPAGNRVASAIHNRMPVILADPDMQRAWLDPALRAEEALALCGPLAASRMTARPANPAVNKVDAVEEGPELLDAPVR